jgi:hypothetical protein
MNQGKRGRPRKDPNQIITPAKAETARVKREQQQQINQYKQLQLYYYFTSGRSYLKFSEIADHDRTKLLRKLDILDTLNITYLFGAEKVFSPANLTDWYENLYQHRFELQRFYITITRKTRLACAAQRVVRLFGLDLVYLDRVTENGRLVHRYRGVDCNPDDRQVILEQWLERDQRASLLHRSD